MASDEKNWIPVPENPDANIVIIIPVTEERTGNGSSWAEIVEAERPGVSHSDPARAVYPSHLRSVVNSFDETMPAERLGELPAGDQLRLFQLNGLPNRPCTARFSLPDNSVDARTILEQIMDTGVQRNHILCIQRLRTGMVEVTFAKEEDCDLFLSRAAIPSRHLGALQFLLRFGTLHGSSRTSLLQIDSNSTEPSSQFAVLIIKVYFLRRYMMADVCYAWSSVAIYHHLSNLVLS